MSPSLLVLALLVGAMVNDGQAARCDVDKCDQLCKDQQWDIVALVRGKNNYGICDFEKNFCECYNPYNDEKFCMISAEVQNLDLLRLLMKQPLIGMSPQRWDRSPNIEDLSPGFLQYQNPDYEDKDYNTMSASSSKRSAVATALNTGRRRRQPAPALGILNDMGNFFGNLRDNLETMASLTPEQRATIYDEPTVVRAPSSGGGGGSGIRKLHALRPLRPTGNIRSYNRRSLVEADNAYPGANRHDPGLLWTGLGR